MLTRRTTLTGMAHAAPVRGLGNARASSQARTLYACLWSQYGKRTLTGQQEQGYNPENAQRELDSLVKVTGHAPAILGFDHIDPRDDARVNARALAWAQSGGIVTLLLALGRARHRHGL